MEDQYLTITNRRLEQFLYNHNINCVKMGKTEDFLTCWTYERTPELVSAMVEFKEILGC